jgi:hypothetical protein
MAKKGILTGLLVLLLSNVYSLEFAVSGADLELELQAEYNRSFRFCWDIAALGSLELNDLVTLSGGLALGMTGTIFDIDTVIAGEVAMPFWSPLFLGIAYSYNGLTGYKTNIHTLRPTVSINGNRAGVTVGTALRFSDFADDSAVVFEPILIVSVFFNFWNTEKMRIGMRIANFSEFTTGNFGSYSLSLNSLVHLAKISLINEIELRQSGSIGLSANFYSIVYKGGVLFTW